jgi:hypothetical protein
MEQKRKRPVGNHEADMGNGNKGTPGTNITWDKNQGERGRQIAEQRQHKR